MTDLNFVYHEFAPWPKIARLNRDITITEKIDGSNAAIAIVETVNANDNPEYLNNIGYSALVEQDDKCYVVGAQSRKQVIVPGKTDNFGFAEWVRNNAADLVRLLGEGRHFGEWWGAGIQRKYGLTNNDKRFSLFNTFRYGFLRDLEENGITFKDGTTITSVPVLYEGPFSELMINGELGRLKNNGSVAAPGFMDPEGVVVFHQAANQMFKVTIKGDEAPKGKQG